MSQFDVDAGRGQIEIPASFSLPEKDTAATAVMSSQGQVDFGQFIALVEATIRRLDQQVADRAVVALELDRSLELLVCMCAVLRSGRVFTVVSPTEKEARREHIFRTTRAQWLLRPGSSPGVVELQALVPMAASGLSPSPLPDDLAYVLFTSGTTGLPKGVEITRRGLHNYLNWAARHYRIERLHGAVAQLNAGFDASITQLLLPVLSGRSVHVVSPGDEITGMATMLRRADVAWLLKLTPSQVHALGVELGPEYASNAAGELVLGGEALDVNTATMARRMFPHYVIHNEYGPTETVVGSTVYVLSSEQLSESVVPIGKAIDATSVCVIDEYLRELDAGEEGEILIGGEGVARGYSGLPRETAMKFVPDPRRVGARAYRSGDFASMDTDGTLHYLGRRDDQVKVRGFRIELAEVRALLAALPAVAEVAVDAPEIMIPYRARELHAYVKLEANVSLEQVREQAAHAIPQHFLPSRWFEVTAIPLNANGKLDTAALRAQSGLISVNRQDHVTSEALDKTMMAWATVLGHSQFGPDDHFYAVGGHSILAIRLAAALRKIFGATVTLAALVECSTPRRMCELFTAEAIASTSRSATVQLIEFPLSPVQTSMWLATRAACRRGLPDPYLAPSALHIHGELDLDRLRTAFADVVRRHGIFYTRLLSREGEVVQRLEPEPSWAWQVELSDSAEAAVARLQHLASQPLDLEVDPVVTLSVIVVGPAEHFLLLRLHHLFTDEWSTHILVQESTRAYAHGAASLESAPPRDAYAAYWRDRTVLTADDQLSYWRDALAGTEALPELPRLTAGVSRASRVNVRIPGVTLAALRTRAHVDRVSLNGLIAAAVGMALGVGGHLPQVRLSTPVTLRDDDAVMGVCGYFLNTVIFRIPVDPAATLDELVKAASDDVLQALSHKDLPHDEIVVGSHPLASGAHAHARFAFLDFVPLPEFDGCTVAPVSLAREGVKFDLLVSAQINEDNLDLAFDFDQGVYDPTHVSHWLELADAIVRAVANRDQGTLADVVKHLARNARHNHDQRREALAASLRRVNRASRSGDLPAVGASLETPPWLGGGALLKGESDEALPQFLRTRTGLLGDSLHRHGAVLLRGFASLAVETFEQVICEIGGQAPQEYENRSTPRTRVSSNIFTSTEYPAESIIPLHSENSYSSRWPRQIIFWCREAAPIGGETPIVDNRKVLATIPADVRTRFKRHGVRYLRNYGVLGLSWQETFQTSCRDEVEAYCRQNRLEWEWRGPDGLRTWQVLPATRRHPVTGDEVWFNQAHLFHVSSLGDVLADELRSLCADDDLPRHACLGDGSAITVDELAAIRTAYDQHEIVFAWQQNDIIALDNMLFGHGRRPYQGARSVLVGMTNMIDGAISNHVQGELR